MNKFLGYVGVGLREIFWITVAVALVFGGIQGFRYLGENREFVEPAPIERSITLVETTDIFIINAPLPIRGEGFTEPFRVASLSGQIGGQIIELHPAITNLGTFEKGDVLARLDDSTERAALAQTEANISGARARLALNTTLLERTETLRVGGNTSQAELDLVRSQNQELVSNLNSLIAAQRAAEISLDRKVITAPFDGAVLTNMVEIGTVVNVGQAIAEIYTQNRMQIEVPLREADASLVPGLFQDASPPAIVSIRFAGQNFEWDARVTRVAPTLDPRTRTLTVTVELDDVNGAHAPGTNTFVSGAPPALINSFAKVVIEGSQPDKVYPVPSTALRSGERLWVFEPETDGVGNLRIIEAVLVHVDGETSYVRIEDLPPLARLITTAVPIPQEGMKLLDVFAADQSATVQANISE